MAKNSNDAQSERLHMRISQEELTAIDDWRFANRVPTRSDAVRRLAQIGIISSHAERSIGTATSEFLNEFEEFERNIEYGFDRSKNFKPGDGDDFRHIVYDIAQVFSELMLSLGLLIDRIDAFRDPVSTLKSEGDVSKALQISRDKVAELKERSQNLSLEVERIRKGETGQGS